MSWWCRSAAAWGCGLVPIWATSSSRRLRPGTHSEWVRGQVVRQERYSSLFDHLVGAGQQRRWHFEAERLGGLEIDDQFVLGGCLHWQIGRPLAFENAIYVGRRASALVDAVSP